MPNPTINRRVVLASQSDTPLSDVWAKVNVPANGGTVSSTTLAAARVFERTLNQKGLRSLIVRLNLYAGDQLAACLVPFIYDKGTAKLDTNSGSSTFQNSDYTEATGLSSPDPGVPTPTRYLDTGLNPSTDLTSTSVHISIYERTFSLPSGSNSAQMGCWTDSTHDLEFDLVYSGTTSYFQAYNDSADYADFSDSSGVGFYHGVRTGSSLTLYKNGSSAATSATVSGSLPNANFYIHCYNKVGTGPFAVTIGKIAGYSVGASMTGTQASDFYDAWQAFQTSLGRQV